MCNLFKYCRDEWFARIPEEHQERYPCYRTVICHALFTFYKNKTDNQSDTKELFLQLRDAYLKNTLYIKKDFLELYPISMRDNLIGYLLVDKTNGCFPLVIYPHPKISEGSGQVNPSRKSALEQVMNDLFSNIDGIIAKFNNHQEWSIELQNELQSDYFHYKEKE